MDADEYVVDIFWWQHVLLESFSVFATFISNLRCPRLGSLEIPFSDDPKNRRLRMLNTVRLPEKAT